MKLYKYSGTIEELAVERGRISYIKLFDVTDFDKAPTSFFDKSRFVPVAKSETNLFFTSLCPSK